VDERWRRDQIKIKNLPVVEAPGVPVVAVAAVVEGYLPPHHHLPRELIAKRRR
jgi:hypothetical protein